MPLTNTDEQIERKVENRMDSLDRQYMAGQITGAEYDAKIDKINAWADRAYLEAETYSE